MGDESEGRHCAYCLSFVPQNQVKLCGSCLRRVYCSKECQRLDWPSKLKTKDSMDKGQGHKDWCKLKCCEEDLNWVVSQVPGKGFGLIAKTFIPFKSKIIVEAPCPINYPAFQDLMPIGGTTEQKIHLNELGVGQNGQPVVCLRIVRANHSCEPNASHFYEETFKVKILYAERDIEPGEEICINYQPFLAFSHRIYEDLEYRRYTLGLKWGITCPSNCHCRKDGIEKLIEECKRLDSVVNNRGNETMLRLNAAKLLLEKQSALKTSLYLKKQTLVDAFEIAIMHPNTLKEGIQFMTQVYDILICISSPKSKESLECQQFIKFPQTHLNYLKGSNA